MRTIALWLSLGLVFVIPWENDIRIAGLGSLARAVGLLATAFWVGTVLVRGQLRRPTPFHAAVFLFVLWNAASIFWTRFPVDSFDRIETYVQLFVLTLLLWDLYLTPRAMRFGMQAYVLGGVVAVVYTVINYFSGAGYRGGARFSVSGLNPNNMGVMLALGIPLAWYLATSSNWGRNPLVLRIISYAYIPGAVLAILLSASRTSLVAAVPGFLYILLSFTRLRLFTRILVFIGLAYALFALQPLVPETSFERLSETGSSISSGDLTGRVDIWQDGLNMFVEQPIWGVGSGVFRQTGELNKPPHNVFLSVLVEGGIIGMVLFVLAMLLVVRQIVRHDTWWDRSLWLTLFLIWAAGAFTLNWEYRKVTWLIFSFVVCSANLYRPERHHTTASAVVTPHALANGRYLDRSMQRHGSIDAASQ